MISEQRARRAAQPHICLQRGFSPARKSCLPQLGCVRYSRAEICCLRATGHVELVWKKGLLNPWAQGVWQRLLILFSLPCILFSAFSPVLRAGHRTTIGSDTRSSWMYPCLRHLISLSVMDLSLVNQCFFPGWMCKGSYRQSPLSLCLPGSSRIPQSVQRWHPCCQVLILSCDQNFRPSACVCLVSCESEAWQRQVSTSSTTLYDCTWLQRSWGYAPVGTLSSQESS